MASDYGFQSMDKHLKKGTPLDLKSMIFVDCMSVGGCVYYVKSDSTI